jgi:hypothetical protein
MNKFTIEYLATTSANVYFWVFIIFISVNILYMFTDEFNEILSIRKKNGLQNPSISFSSFIAWFLFILSIYYK